ncbi:hypothetical protein, partial [Brevundimonas aurantiaca]|uniref:hypothetical protein n=1 Tax=Brevundimonas aurantiaca TaxID=74316 RepID=UPI0040344B08
IARSLIADAGSEFPLPRAAGVAVGDDFVVRPNGIERRAGFDLLVAAISAGDSHDFFRRQFSGENPVNGADLGVLFHL